MRGSLMVSALALALALPSGASAAPREIDVDDDFFAPRNPPTRNLQSGPSFRWTSVPGAMNPHNVRQDDRLFFSGNPTDPLEFQIRASAGSYHYYCTLHGSRQGGMAGRVKVKPIRDRDPSGLPFTVIWARPGTNTGGSFDVRFKRGSGDWRIWKNDTERLRGVFGRNRNPVRVRANKVYKFQARSERTSNPSRRSDWSPTLRVST